jgi:hypothetical protein
LQQRHLFDDVWRCLPMSATHALIEIDCEGLCAIGKPRLTTSECLALRYIPIGVSVGFGIAMIRYGPIISLLPFIVLIGFGQLGGLCGAAHLRTMGALWTLKHSLWLRGVTAYTFAGMLSSLATGSILGLAGAIAPSSSKPIMFGTVALMGIASLLRETGLLVFAIPERHCQTLRNWAYEYGWVGACAMWGFHIGVAFSTVITFASFWVLVAFIVALGRADAGAVLMGAYWIGRCLPLWLLAPLASRTETWSITQLAPLLRPAHVVALGWFVGVALLTEFGYR